MAESTNNYYELNYINCTKNTFISGNNIKNASGEVVKPANYSKFAVHFAVYPTTKSWTSSKTQYIWSSNSGSLYNICEYYNNSRIYFSCGGTQNVDYYNVSINTQYNCQMNHESGSCGTSVTGGGDLVNHHNVSNSKPNAVINLLGTKTGTASDCFVGRCLGGYFRGGSSFNNICNFKPAIRISDNAVGLYDTDTNIFYTSSGTEQFTKGSYKASYTLTLNSQTGGSVSGGGTVYKRINGAYKQTITATPTSGYKFDGWYSDSARTKLVNSSASYTVSLSANTTLYAKFSLKQSIYYKVDGAWKPANIYYKVDGAWKPADVYYKVDGAWKNSKI